MISEKIEDMIIRKPTQLPQKSEYHCAVASNNTANGRAMTVNNMSNGDGTEELPISNSAAAH